MRNMKWIVGAFALTVACGPKGGAGGQGAGGETAGTGGETAGTGGATAGAGGETTGAGGSGNVVLLSMDQIGLSSAALDRSADPCDDFYQFACGNWIAQTKIPPDQARWGRSFSEIHKRNQIDMKKILTDAAATVSKDPITKALGDYYGACMDEAAVEKAGLSGIEPLLKKARAVRSRKQIVPTLIELHTYGISPGFASEVEQDFKSPDKNVAFMAQGGIGLPDRDYYLDKKFKDKRDRYATYVTNMMRLSGLSAKKAKAAAKDVMSIETALAKASKTRVEMRNIPALYNKVDRPGLKKLAPAMDWTAYYTAQGVPELKDVIVTSKEFFTGFNKLLRKTRVSAWSNYLQWNILRATANTLPKRFVDEQFAMRQALTGQKEQRPRWKRCVADTDGSLREYTGRAYVKIRFDANAKKAVIMMIDAIRNAFGVQLAGYDWMDAATLAKAQEKRTMMAFLIGYPDEWKDYPFKLDRGNYALNSLAASKYDVALNWAKTKKPVDRKEWSWSAATVNASYNPLRNAMTYPAGILQPPFYNPNANIPVNLGALGMVVGHEMTHGFDDQGSLFAGNGVMSNWWSPTVSKAFDAKKQCVVDKYNSYEALPGMHVNGELTLGENIADLGGVKLAFKAYRKLRAGATAPVVADGFNEDQQFFLAVGQTWCSKQTDELTKQRLQTDSHSPPGIRVRGALSNLSEFAEAFHCKAGQAMAPKNSCSVW